MCADQGLLGHVLGTTSAGTHTLARRYDKHRRNSRGSYFVNTQKDESSNDLVTVYRLTIAQYSCSSLTRCGVT